MNDNDRRSNKNVSLYLKKHFSVSAVASTIAINLLPLVAQAEEIIMIGDREIEVTIAETRQEQAKGLQGTTSLPDSKGMLFVFEPARKVCFWMKGTPIDLDVGFFDQNNRLIKVDFMQANMLDLHCSPTPISYALETSAGWFNRYKVSLGSQLKRPQQAHADAQ